LALSVLATPSVTCCLFIIRHCQYLQHPLSLAAYSLFGTVSTCNTLCHLLLIHYSALSVLATPPVTCCLFIIRHCQYLQHPLSLAAYSLFDTVSTCNTLCHLLLIHYSALVPPQYLQHPLSPTAYSLSDNLEQSGRITFLCKCFWPTTDRWNLLERGTGKCQSLVTDSVASFDDFGSGVVHVLRANTGGCFIIFFIMNVVLMQRTYIKCYQLWISQC
jgi:hypothetical protein